jgi:simple sugar transport system permease protein
MSSLWNRRQKAVGRRQTTPGVRRQASVRRHRIGRPAFCLLPSAFSFPLSAFRRSALRAARPLAALAAAFALAGLLVAVTYGHPFHALLTLLRGAFGDGRAWGGSLAKATPILFTGLAIAIAFRGGFFNIGVEGQLYAGALTAAVVGHRLTAPFPLHLAAALLAGMLAGALWALPAAFLKSRRGVHEVISTIMLNYVAVLLTDWLASGPLKAPDRMGPQTPAIALTARLPRLLSPTELNAGFLIAIGAALLLGYLLTRTPLGLEIRALGLNPQAAWRTGIAVERTLVVTFALSGALAGLAGAVEILGVHYSFSARFSPGYGFDGIAVALLAANAPLAVIATGIFFGGLSNGSVAMEVDAGVSRYLVTMIQAFAVVAVAVRADWFGRFRSRGGQR